jgi:hypothetical protein
MLPSIDYDKFRALRVTHVATRFEELIGDETNDTLTPEQLFLTAVDDALEQRRHSRLEKLIRQAKFPIPHASVASARLPRRRRHRGDADASLRCPYLAGRSNKSAHHLQRGGKTYFACAIGISACLNEHTVSYARMDDLGRRLVITRSDGIAHQQLRGELSDVDLLIIDDFLTVGIDSDAASDLFAVLANREHRLPTLIASQSGPSYWAQALPDRAAADSIVNRLANHSRAINLGSLDMRKLRDDQARADKNHWE